MAANLQRRGLASVGKWFVGGSWITGGSVPALAARRSVHGSVYDKNVDEQVRPTVVPDNVIELKSEEYWAPHPKTGVFGPTADKGVSAKSGQPAVADGPDLEEKVWYRPLEDLDQAPLN